MQSDELLLFSTDYPHWQFDGEEALPEGLSPDLVRKIMIDNPHATYPPPDLARAKGDNAMNSSSATVRSRLPPLTVKTAIADCDIHPARATATELYPYWPNAGTPISKSTASMPIRA